jgi:hypothetical protein
MSDSRQGRGIVVQYPNMRGDHPEGHETTTRATIARKLAALKQYDFVEHYEPGSHAGKHVYFVPDDTLEEAHAHKLGIHSEDDLFGGVVRYPFVATKTITHPVYDDRAIAPAGWSHDFTRRAHDVVLEGYSAFSVEDARRAGTSLLERGSARVKPALGRGGVGQARISNGADLDKILAAMDADELARYGVVIERDLSDVTTYSVGQVHMSGKHISYFGTQRLTKNAHGVDVYGGSGLLVVRGDFDALLQLPLATDEKLAISQACVYDRAASNAYDGLIASRRNYDVARGRDGDGVARTGVLEQSWRIGGASPAEVAAFAAFAADPALTAVRASSTEVYGTHEPPSHAVIHFSGIDQRVGRITKYSTIDAHEKNQP